MTPVEQLLYVAFLWIASGAAWFWIDNVIRAWLRLKVPGPEYAIACSLGGFVAVFIMVLALIRAYLSDRRRRDISLAEMIEEARHGRS